MSGRRAKALRARVRAHKALLQAALAGTAPPIGVPDRRRWAPAEGRKLARMERRAGVVYTDVLDTLGRIEERDDPAEARVRLALEAWAHMRIVADLGRHLR